MSKGLKGATLYMCFSFSPFFALFKKERIGFGKGKGEINDNLPYEQTSWGPQREEDFQKQHYQPREH